MEDNVNTFLRLYNDLDDALREKYRILNRSQSVITKYVSSLERSTFKEHNKRARILNMIRILRNDLIHELDANMESLMQINDSTIEFLENEIKFIKNPILAVHIMTPIANMFVAKLDDPLREVLIKMVQKGYTQVPIVDDNNRLFGVLSPNAMFLRLAKKDENPLLADRKLIVRDFEEYLPIKSHVSEVYLFIERRLEAEEILEIFEDCSSKGKKLQVLFVTENGNEHEKILGMIVPSDIINYRARANE